MTSCQRIDRSREGRLWITQVIVPTVMAIGIIKSNPELNNAVKTRWEKVKTGFKMMIS